MAMGEAGVRTGLTTIKIEHLKQVYGRDPCPFGANTLDMHARQETPYLSARMRQELDATFGGRSMAAGEKVHKGMRVPQPVPLDKQLVGGLLLTRSDVAASMALASSRSGASTARRDLRSARSELEGDKCGGSEVGPAVTTCRSCSTARGGESSARVGRSARSSARTSARRSARADSARSQTARLQAQKDVLADQLLAVSKQLKVAVCKPKIDPTFAAALVKSDSQIEDYDRAVGYRCLMRTRNTSVHKGDFGMDHFDRPLSPKEFARELTDMGECELKLAQRYSHLPRNIADAYAPTPRADPPHPPPRPNRR